MSWPWQRSIQNRITLVVVGLLLAVLVLVNLGMAFLLLRAQVEETANHLQIQALAAAQTLQDPLASYASELRYLEERAEHEEEQDEEQESQHEDDEEDSGPESSSLLPGWASALSRSTGSRVLVSDLDGRLLAGEGRPTSAELAGARGGRSLHRWSQDTIYAMAPVLGREGKPRGLIRLSAPRSDATARSRALSLALLVASLAALGLGALVAAALSRRLVQPLMALERSAHEAARGHWEVQIPVEGQDELASLSRAFSSMLAELQTMVERQRRFVSHASHELRTPLTRIKLRTEALVNGALQDPGVASRFVRELDGEVDRLTRLTNALLDLSRLEERGPAPSGVAEPLPLLRQALERVRPLAESKSQQLQSELPATLPALSVSPEALEIVVDNLLDNAVKYAPEGGSIVLTAGQKNGAVELCVSDNGPGIPAEHQPHVFERFYRVDSTGGAPGFGLGLALVKAVISGAGGEVGVASSLEGGARIWATIPARQ